MKPPVDEAGALAGRLAPRLAPLIAEIVRAEIDKLPKPVPVVHVRTMDQEIMAVCRKVANAVDRLVQAKYGPGEIAARQHLERTAKEMRTILRRHKRLGPEE